MTNKMEDIQQLIDSHVHLPILEQIGKAADAMGRECYVVGGYVRDIFLHRPSNDIDLVTVGSGIELARKVSQQIARSHLSVFRNYGTAQVKTRNWELEFVGARRESYQRNSRNPIVEDGTLEDDQRRRDFTINAMAICINQERYGELLDPFDGISDLEKRLIRTPLDADITFSDDPLRMMRAIRFATQLDFQIYPTTFKAIQKNAHRIKIITRERIADELMKIMRSTQPSRGWQLLDQSGLLELILPELAALKGVETIDGKSHKDNFEHTLQVLDHVAAKSDNVWLRWAALLHDIGKPKVKSYDPNIGWTFYSHNFVGEKMIPRIFAKMRLPQNEHMKYVKKLVGLHMRPIALVEEQVTDSAVRRLLFDAGDDIDDLMTLCHADITSKNPNKVQRLHRNFELVAKKLISIEEKDRVRNFQPPIDGEDIMALFGLPPSRPIGEIKEAIKEAILDGRITNHYAPAYQLMLVKAQELGLTPLDDDKLCITHLSSPVGELTIAGSTTGIAYIGWGNQPQKLQALASKLRLSPIDKITPLLRQCMQQLEQYFEGKLQEFSLPLLLSGTDFQKQVWDQLVTIPYGTTMSYAQQAQQIGRPKATRAVAMANHANPIPIVVPCHRVINKDGSLGGYAPGVEIKRWLLDHEASHRPHLESGEASTD